MKKQVYFHVGVGKTGTTSIQDYLYKNRNLLEILYPETGFADHYKNHYDLFFDKNFDKLFDKLFEEIKESDNEKIILSSESGFANLFYQSKHKLFTKKFIEMKKMFDVKILIYVLDPSRYVRPSFENQKHYVKNLNDFFHNNARYVCDYPKTIIGYSNIFGKENVLVYSFENSVKKTKNKDIIEHFCNVVDIPYIREKSAPLNKSSINIQLSSNFKNYIFCHFSNCYTEMRDLFTDISDYNYFLEIFNKNKSVTNLNTLGYDIVKGKSNNILYESISKSYYKYLTVMGFEKNIKRRTSNFHCSNNDIMMLFTEEVKHKIKEHLCCQEILIYTSLFFEMPTEQAIHNDSPYFSTYPQQGAFVGVWFALEDVEDNGPLVGIPGDSSRYFDRLFEINSSEYENDLHRKDYDKVWRHFQENWCDSETDSLIKFKVNAGDSIVWDSSFDHGGGKSKDCSLTRKSVVFHVVAKNTEVYQMENFFLGMRDSRWSNFNIVKFDHDLWFVRQNVVTK
jgi:ectoine hydroxylase-related dioxygenase (phytanoyl-CoA dioxygenase family)